MPERWAAIWCSQATKTPNRDAIRSARSGSDAPTSMAGTPIGETAIGTVGVRAATPAAIVASALIAASHSHSESPPHSAHSTSKSSSGSPVSVDSSSAGDQMPPTLQTMSYSQSHPARRRDHGPPSPGAGENSWRYSPEPRQITGVIDPSIAVSPTTALPSRASRPTLALSGSGVRCPRRPRRLRRTPPDHPLHQPVPSPTRRKNRPGASSDSCPTSRLERTAHQFTRVRSHGPRAGSLSLRTSLSCSPSDLECRLPHRPRQSASVGSSFVGRATDIRSDFVLQVW